jgi:hypothetical protein
VIVVLNPLPKNPSEVRFREGDSESRGTLFDQCAQCARRSRSLLDPDWGSEYFHAERLQHLVQFFREDLIPVMNDVSISVVFGKRFTELLEGPVRCGMGGDIVMHDPARSDLHEHEYTTASGGVAIWLMNGATIIGSTVTLFRRWLIADVSDFNEDGRSDILWTTASSGVAIWFMNGRSIRCTTLDLTHRHANKVECL